MNATLALNKERKASWNKVSTGWHKWDREITNWLQPFGDAIIHFLAPVSDAHILDVASGTGEPGLSIARLVPNGRVLISDHANEMLEIAKRKVELGGFTNVTTAVADSSDLPFNDETWDAVSCRFGFTHFNDMDMAASEMIRVLKPGGRFATVVWGPPENNHWKTCLQRHSAKYVPEQGRVDRADGFFKYAGTTDMTSVLEGAGFRSIANREVRSILYCGGAEKYWEMMKEIDPDTVSVLSTLTPSVVEQIRTDVINEMTYRYPNGSGITSVATLYTAVK